jgi:hypothetical protein
MCGRSVPVVRGHDLRVAGEIARRARRLGKRPTLRRERREPTDAVAESYRFWHLDYGSTAYYDQLVFKRHDVIPPRHPPRGT